jgi:peptidoglycan/xylan/chitin deacetylase (PgdA/CDA1 family)
LNLFDVHLVEDIYPYTDITYKESIATISFDDGYKDNIEFAKPILDKFKIKASFYVVTDCISQNIPIWTFKLDETLKHYHSNIRIPAKNGLEDFLIENKFVFPNQASILKSNLKKLSFEKQQAFLSAFYKLNNSPISRVSMMNWDDLRLLKGEGHYIGSHTCTHPMLGAMSDVNDIYRELEKSRNDIEKELGVIPKTISYPIGSYNPSVSKIAKSLGYEVGLAVDNRVYDTRVHDNFSIPRIELYEENILKMLLRSTGITSFVKSII